MKQENGNGRSDRRVRPRHNDKSWTEFISEEPIACLAMAAAAGFVLGGGTRQQGGFAILTMLGQIIVKETLGQSAIGELLGGVEER